MTANNETTNANNFPISRPILLAVTPAPPVPRCPSSNSITGAGDYRQTNFDYVLVFGVSSHEKQEEKLREYRRVFEKLMRSEGLTLSYEMCKDLNFVKISCPFDRLAKEAELMRLEMPLKNCAIPQSNSSSFFRRLTRCFVTDDEVDFISGPFYLDRLHAYEGSENPDAFFRSATRSLLVHHILINLDMSKYLSTSKVKKQQTVEEQEQMKRSQDDVVSRMGLLHLLMYKVYKDAFILHEKSKLCKFFVNLKKKSKEKFEASFQYVKVDPRRDLERTWNKFFKFQPLWKIRNYFGEEIAFHFAWQGYLISMMWFPALLGLISFVYGLYITYGSMSCLSTDTDDIAPSCQGLYCQHPSSKNTTVKASTLIESTIFRKTFDNKLTPFISLFICLWGSLFVEFWHRKNSRLAYEWDCDVYDDAQPDRPEFVGTKKIYNPVTKQQTWIYPRSSQSMKFITSGLIVFALILIMWFSVMLIILLKVAFRNIVPCSAIGTAGDSIVEKPLFSTTIKNSNFSNNTAIPQNSNSDSAAATAAMAIDYDDYSSILTATGLCFAAITVLPAFLNGFLIMFMGYVAVKVARRLTEWENHRTLSEFNDALIVKLFALQFVNTYTPLIYLAVFRPEEHNFQPDGVFNMGHHYADTCRKGNCMALISLQIFVLMVLRPAPKILFDVIIPFCKSKYKAARAFVFSLSKIGPSDSDCALNEMVGVKASTAANNDAADSKIVAKLDLPLNGAGDKRTTASSSENGDGSSIRRTNSRTVLELVHQVKQKFSVSVESTKSSSFCEAEYRKVHIDDCFYPMIEYMEKVLEFGYIVMFAASFPLAPMIALLISLFDVRFEVKRLLWILRRPVAFIASDIGMWFPIMRFVCFCGVISNGFIVAFTSSFCEDFFETNDVPTTQRLLVFITFEHVVFGIMYLFHICIPSTPANIRLAQRRERYEVMRILERNKYLNRQDLYDSSLCLSSDEDLKNTPSTAKKSNLQQSEVLGAIRTPVFLLTDIAENN